MQYRDVMGVSSLPAVGAKNGIFRVYTVKNDRNRHENDYFVVLLYVLLAMYARKVPFLPVYPTQ